MDSASFDIIGSLPVELSHRVLQYLSSNVIVISRRVSKVWNRLLTDEAFCKFLCRSRYDLDTTHKDTPTCWDSYFLQIASRRHALAYGRPWAKALHSCDLMDQEFPKMGYNDGLLAWYEHGNFVILDLENGSRRKHSSSSYKPPQTLQITKRFLVWFESRHLRAYSLSTSRASALNLPLNLDPKNVAWDICDDMVIFMAPKPNPGFVEVTLWQINEGSPTSDSSQMSNSFTIELPGDFDSCTVAFKKATDSNNDIDLIITTASETYVAKYGQDGSIQSEWSPIAMEKRWDYDEDTVDFEKGMTMGLLKSATTCFDVSECGILNPITPTASQILFSGSRKYIMRWVSLLTRRSQKSAILRSLIFGHNNKLDGEQEDMVLHTVPVKPDTVYFAPINSLNNVRIIHQFRDKVRLLKADFHYDDDRFSSSLESNSRVQFVHRTSMAPVVHTIFIDDRFFILASKANFEVFSFDKDAALAEELKDYREGRMVRMRERLARNGMHT